MASIDTDINNYSTEELAELFGINQPFDIADIDTAAKPLLAKASSKGDNNLTILLKNARSRLIKESQSELENDSFKDGSSSQLLNWKKFRYPFQNNELQDNKTTSRYNKIDTLNASSHFPMERQRLGINSNVVVPVTQGIINPNTKNVMTKTISIDSRYRSNIFPYANGDTSSPSFATDFTVYLTDSLTNVLSLELYSIHIPTTWYAVDTIYGNTCFVVSSGGSNATKWIEPGNYTPAEYGSKVQELIRTEVANVDVSYSSITGKYTISNSPSDFVLIFYQEEGFTDVSSCVSCTQSQNAFQNVGWTMGWKIEPSGGKVELSVPATTDVTSTSPADLNGPKYFILSLDDNNQNVSNKGIVGISQQNIKLDIPSYTTPANAGCDETTTPPTVEYVETAPRRRTKAQLYTINAILEDRITPNIQLNAPNPSDVLAVIPLQNVASTRPEPIIEYNSTIRSNKRDYFGPVNISRLRIRLYDDRGNLVDLHGSDWSIALTSTQLYQY